MVSEKSLSETGPKYHSTQLDSPGHKIHVINKISTMLHVKI